MIRYPRDMRGYGPHPPDPQWPDRAKIAVQFVLNYEEGGENNVLHGDAASEAFLSEVVGAQPWPGQRHWNMESMYEYGARAGFWRLHRLFTSQAVPATVYGVATALARSPEQVEAMKEADWEIASHGLKWIEYKDFSEEDELEHLKAAKELHLQVTGTEPKGWYTGRCSENTLRLIAEDGSFDYVSDDYSDDLPYWSYVAERPQLVIPYTLDANDMRFATAQGFNSGEQFFQYLKDSFDTLYAEGVEGAPKMMSVGLHCRLAGRPGRTAAIRRFIDYIKGHDAVWIARRIDIAKHWAATHPPKEQTDRPSHLPKDRFVATFGSIFEHSDWVAEETFELELGPAHDCATGLHNAMCRTFRAASPDKRRKVLNAHPDLAGKLAAAKRLTQDSAKEQASAGLDALTEAEHATFTDLNSKYAQKFGFPFIIAVRDHTKGAIIEQFKMRLTNDADEEFHEACRQVERIALHRLKELLP